MMIILILLSSGVYQVSSTDSFEKYSFCTHFGNTEVEIQNLPGNKYSSVVTFPFDYDSFESLMWPCATSNPPNDTLKQILTVLNLLHLTDRENSCDQTRKLYSVTVAFGSVTKDYDQLGPIKRNFSAVNQSVCGNELEKLELLKSPKSMNEVILNDSFCRFRKLRALSIVYSENKDVNAEAFICLENLFELNLKWNNIKSLPERVFSHNPRLQKVELFVNLFNFSVFSSLQPLTNVSILNLGGNKMEILPEAIPLKRLKHLQLDRNKMREIFRDAFSNLEEIEYIDLSDNKLTEFHEETFRNNEKLKILISSNNQLKSMPKIDNLSKLEHLDLSYNKISGWINLGNLLDNHIYLKNLFLSDNEIEGIVETSTSRKKYTFSSKTLSNLSINLSNNRIQSLINVLLPHHLTTFNLVNNRIQTVCISSFDFNPESKNVLHLSGNPLRCNCVNRELQLPFYQMLISDFADLKCELLATPLKPKESQRVKLAELEEDGSVCRIDFNSSEQCVCYGISDCSSNPLNEHCYALTDAMRSKITHVCEHLTEIPSLGYYKHLIALSKHDMYFSRNNIETLKLLHFGDDRISAHCVSFCLEKSNVRTIEKDAFNRMANLEILSLRDNNIRVLPDNLFQKLTKLKELYLSNNRLITLSGQTIIKQVIKLELHRNSLTHLPINIKINALLLSSNLTNLSLHDNPWSCECQFIQLLHNYLGNNTHIIQRVKHVKCTDNNEYYNVLQFDLSKCRPFQHLTAIVTSTTFAVVVIVIVIFIFLYRREVRVLIYSRYHIRIFGPEVDDDVSGKQYDAFIAYNNKDEELVVHELMPGLEAIPKPYRLCVHERDFPAGAFIQDSILEAVRLSSRTIVLLSQNFVDSGWCRLEFMTAHAQMLQDRCPRVLLIVRGEIPRTLDPEMELYLRTNTYLRWGERLFWEKLYYAMPDKRVTTPPTDIMPMREL